MVDSVRWVVTTDGQREVGEVAADLTARGLVTEQVLDQIGVIVGAAAADARDRLTEVPGVAAVETEPPGPDIGPPDAPVTW